MPNSRRKLSKPEKLPAPPGNPTAVEAVWFTQTTLTFDLADGRSISVPLSFYPKLLGAPQGIRLQHEIHQSCVYWCELSFKLTAKDLLSGRKRG